MASIAVHFLFGTAGALALFLLCAYLSGERSFSAPFGVVIVGIACATLSHFISPWATPFVLGVYAAVSVLEVARHRSLTKGGGS